MEPHAFFKTKTTLWLGFLSLLLYLSGFLIWLTPLPLIYAYRKQDRALGLSAMVLAALGLWLLYQVIIPMVVGHFDNKEPSQIFSWMPGMSYGEDSSWNPVWFGVSYYLFYAAMGIMLGEWGDRAKNMTLLVGRTLLYLCIGFFFWVLWQAKGGVGDLIGEIENYFSLLIDQMTSTQGNNSEVQQQLAIIQNYKESIIYYTVRLMPAMIVCMTIVVIWLNVLVAKKLFFKEMLFRNIGSLKEWRLPFVCIWALIATAFLLLLDIYFLHIELFKILALNAFLVFGLMYFFQGLSILVFFSQRWLVSPLIKTIFYILFFIFFQPIGILLLAFGFFDSWFDFRKLAPKAARP